MPYDDIPVGDALNYWLADAFDASSETDLLALLEGGKTLNDLLGYEASLRFYTPERREEIDGFIHVFGLIDMQHSLNNSDQVSAVILSQGPRGELIFAAGNPAGTPAIMTDWFKRDRAKLLDQANR